MIKIIHNAETNEIKEIEMTDEEVFEFETLREKTQKQNESTQIAKNILFEKLGLTEEEAKLLLS